MANGRSADRVVAAASRGSLDPLLVGIVAAIAFALHGFHGALTRDLAIFVYGGVQVAHGVPPYVGNFNTVGPLADVVPGIGVALGRVVGVSPVLSARLLYWVIAAACCSMVYLWTRQVTRSRAAGFLGAALFSTFGTFLDLATNGPREKTLMLLFLVAAFLFAGQRRWVAAGAATALATLTWQPAVLPLFGGAAVLALSTPHRARNVLRYVLGGVVVTLIAVVAFAAQGALGTAVKAFVVVNVRWVHQPSAFHDLGATWHILWKGYHLSLVLVFGGVIALVVAAALRRRDVLLVAAATAGVVAIVWTGSAINGAPDLLVVLPFGALGSAVAIVALAHRIGRTGRVGAALVGTVTVLAVVATVAEAASTGHETLILQVRAVRAVMRTLPPGATIATIDAPQALVFTGRRNPTPYLILDSGETGLFDHERPGGTVGYLRSLLSGDHVLVAIGPGPDQHLIHTIAEARYQPAGRAPGWEWYVARSAGKRLLHRVHRANHAVMTNR